MRITNRYQSQYQPKFQPKFKGSYLDKDEAISNAKKFAPQCRPVVYAEVKVPFTLGINDTDGIMIDKINVPISVFINNDKEELTLDRYQSLTKHISSTPENPPLTEHTSSDPTSYYKRNPIEGIKDGELKKADKLLKSGFEVNCFQAALQQFSGKPSAEQVKILRKQGIEILPEKVKEFLDILIPTLRVIPN
jgi:hypothetical protein